MSPTIPRDAATVLILRDAANGPEVWMLERVQSLAFAPGAHVFPGGAVEAADGDAVGSTLFGDLAARASIMGVDPDRAAALIAAAVRETEEECGAILNPDHLVPWAHWVTPEWSERRFDTWFFVTVVPSDSEPAHLGGEAAESAWWAPGDALREHEAGRMVLLPPTLDSLQRLTRHATASEAIDAAPRLLDWNDG